MIYTCSSLEVRLPASRHLLKHGIFAVFLLLSCSCKKLASTTGQTNSVQKIIPKKIDPAGTGANEDWGAVQLNGSGEFRQKVVLSLDYLPGGQMSGTLPQCLEPLPQDFELGVVLCENGEAKSKPLLAAHVTQECYTRSEQKPIPAAETLRFSSCQKARIYGFRYEPEFRIDIEDR